MIEPPYIPELIRILRELNRIGTQEGLEYDVLHRVLSKNLIEGRFYNQDNLYWLISLGLVEHDDKSYKISEVGKYILGLNYIDVYPTEEQILLLNQCIFITNNKSFKSSLSEFLQSFRVSPKGDSFRIKISQILSKSQKYAIAHLLVQTNVLSIREGWYIVNDPYLEKVGSIRALAKGISPEELAIILKRRKDIGEAAESICIEFEKERLINLGKPILAKMVEHTSKIDVSAGYDLASFNGTSVMLEKDRFIEVKASSGPQVSFYWPKNEVEVASKLRGKYWIYFLKGFNMSEPYTKKPDMFQDPIKSILENPKFEKETDTFYIREVNPK